jgi:hypothetical protein
MRTASFSLYSFQTHGRHGRLILTAGEEPGTEDCQPQDGQFILLLQPSAISCQLMADG